METNPRPKSLNVTASNGNRPFQVEEEDLLLEDITGTGSAIVLYNDDVNTFDWVIQCLIEICGHNRQQAEQCAWFVHSKGKYSVKSGSYDELTPICTALCDRGLSAKIES